MKRHIRSLGVRFGLATNVAAETAATAAAAAPARAASRKPASKVVADACSANTNPSDAVASRPPIRAIALLNPDAVPMCALSTAAITAVVSGATQIAMPIEMNRTAGNTLLQ